MAALLACAAVLAQAQNVTLDECVTLARANYPLIRKYGLIERTAGIELSDINKSWLPRIEAFAQGTVQNEVPAFPDDMRAMLAASGIDLKGIRKDQYKVGLNVSQNIWDGGKTKADREVARADELVQRSANDVELYAVEERVQELYFAILLTEAQVRQTELTAALLQSNLGKLRSMHLNGAAMQSDVDAVEAEYLTVAQQIVRLRGNADSYRRVLEVFIASPLENRTLERPSAEIPSILQSARPELLRFDAEQARINSRRRQVSVSAMPRIGFFAQAGYGYPGLDYFKSMTSREWSLNAMAGLKVSWTIDALYTRKDRLSKLSLAVNDIDVARDVFLFNNRMESVRRWAEIRRQQAVLADDARIVELRTSVRKAAESRLANGVIDTTDLLKKITDESTAAIHAAYHEIELTKTIYQLKHTLNR